MKNLTPLSSWIPKRPRLDKENEVPAVHTSNSARTPGVLSKTTYPSTPTPAPKETSQLDWYDTSPVPRIPLTARKLHQNGFLKQPKTPSYKPYALNNRGQVRRHAFAFSGYKKLEPMEPLPNEEWNALARANVLLKDGQSLRDFQIEAANLTITRKKDLCVISPTGSGKSLLWLLPLLAQKRGISLVIVPYTSLGFQGEQRCELSLSI